MDESIVVILALTFRVFLVGGFLLILPKTLERRQLIGRRRGCCSVTGLAVAYI